MATTEQTRRPRAEVIDAMTAYLVEDKGLDEHDARVQARALLESPLGRGAIARRWWVMALRGVLAIAAGVFFLFSPIAALVTLMIVLGAWIFVDGVFALASVITPPRSWHMALAGALGVVLGWLILTRPESASVVFYVFLAVWVTGRGIVEVALAASMPAGEPGRGTLVFLGITSFLFGLFLIVAPVFGAIALAWWVGAYALFFGVVEIALAFQLRGMREGVEERLERRPPLRAQPQPT